MDTLALRLAAAGGRIDDLPASQLVAAGFTLLQRSAPLVRLLSGRVSALLLPRGPAAVVALAASDGRAAVLLPPDSSDADLTTWCAELDVGAIFTIEALQQRVPSTCGVVLLDQAPRTAMVRTPEGREQTVDLGSHVGLTIEGETDLPGREEACLILPSPPRATLTHRALLAHDPTTEAPGSSAHPSALLLSHLVMPLLAGHTIQTTSSR